ncbi:MAG: methionyl-tRNA formyltransferase [Cryomorphaceae bacterium]|nr:methionyl-tRNA formyltransferase [Cryomorphaceae bacterium]
MRIVFFGTPEFAAISLEHLHKNGIEIGAVVTVADKPSGRGQKLHTSAVKDYAVANQLTVLQPEKLKDEAFQLALDAIAADLFVVVAFRMMPQSVWSKPPLGTINLHGSLLPDYRGAAPIHWAVINGDQKTGCTTFLINEEIDTGQMLDQVEIEIPVTATTGDIYTTLANSGAALLLQTVRKLFDCTVQSRPQILSGKERKAPKIHKEDTKIDWNGSALEIYNFIRGMAPFPAAYTTLNGDVFKIYFSQITDEPSIGAGIILQTKKQLFVCTADFMLEITDLQPAGKKRMPALAFIAGNQIDGMKFE